MSNWNGHILSWVRWLFVTVLLVAKCYVFDVLVAQPEPVEWLLTDYLTKTAAAALIAVSFVLTRRRYVGLLVLCTVDIWMVVNIVYFRAYRLFITWQLFSIATNMSGFERSILPFLDGSLWLFPVLTIPSLLCFIGPAGRFHWSESVVVVMLSALLSAGGSYYRWQDWHDKGNDHLFMREWLNPCRLPECLSAPVWESERQVGRYIRYHSILAYPLFMADDALRVTLPKKKVEWSEEEKDELDKMISVGEPPVSLEGNLLILLLESFESWLLDSYDAQGNPICPALKTYIESHDVLYVRDMETQIQFGMSADGQLLVNTGLYPMMEGVTCVEYDFITYPNLAHFYPSSAVVNPCKNVWNQRVISAAYGYKNIIEPDSENMFEWNDSIVVEHIRETFLTAPSSACIMGITISGHMPFDSHPDPVAVSDTMPPIFQRYLQTARYTDRQIGRLLAWTDTSAVMKGSTIVITGDHRIFHAWINDEIRDYGLHAHLPFGTNYAGCPFIVAGPRVKKRTLEHAEQIDIYPTVLHSIRQDNYYWKGIGRNLLDTDSLPENNMNLRRSISDKLIKTDYFSSLNP